MAVFAVEYFGVYALYVPLCWRPMAITVSFVHYKCASSFGLETVVHEEFVLNLCIISDAHVCSTIDGTSRVAVGCVVMHV